MNPYRSHYHRHVQRRAYLYHGGAAVAGADHSCALDVNGLVCWGRNDLGQTELPVGLVFGRGVGIEAIGEPITSEDGVAVDLSVVLDTRPTADVAVTLGSTDPSEGEVEATTLVFHLDDWNQPRTVGVRGVDDPVCDGDLPYAVGATAASADAGYHGIAIAPVAFSNLDDDAAVIRTLPRGTSAFVYPHAPFRRHSEVMQPHHTRFVVARRDCTDW